MSKSVTLSLFPTTSSNSGDIFQIANKVGVDNSLNVLTASALSSVNVLPSLYIMADSKLPLINPSLIISNSIYTSTLDGWGVKKDSSTTPTDAKINAYFPPPVKPDKSLFTIGDLNALSMVIFPTNNNANSLPFFTLYTVPTPEQIALNPNTWYGKKANWIVTTPSNIVVTDPSYQLSYQLITYVTPIDSTGNQSPPSNIQTASVSDYGFTQIPMSLSTISGVVQCVSYPGTTQTSLLPTDILKYISIGTSSNASTVDFVLNNFAYCTTFGSFQSNMSSSTLTIIPEVSV